MPHQKKIKFNRVDKKIDSFDGRKLVFCVSFSRSRLSISNGLDKAIILIQPILTFKFFVQFSHTLIFQLGPTIFHSYVPWR